MINQNFFSPQNLKDCGRVIWITGLSGSGKSTLATLLTLRIRQCGEPTILLDGDELRNVLGVADTNANNHRREARLLIAMKYSHLCQLLASQGFTVVIATISLFREVHKWNRENLPSYFEVYLKVPLEELRRRDPKGIYRRFYSGQMVNVAGLDLPIDEPEVPDLIAEFETSQTAVMVADNLMKILNKEN